MVFIFFALISGIFSYFVNGTFGVLLTFIAFLFTKSNNVKGEGIRNAYIAISFPYLVCFYLF